MNKKRLLELLVGPLELEHKYQIEIRRAAVQQLKRNNPSIFTHWAKEFFHSVINQHAKDQLAMDLFQHYLYWGGAKKRLNYFEMQAMNQGKVPIDVRRKSKKYPIRSSWHHACNATRASGQPQSYSGKRKAVWDNGAIAHYTVFYRGQVTLQNGKCVWLGSVQFYDKFDMDPRWGWSPNNQQGRSDFGERRTRIAYILELGTDFEIESYPAAAEQSETDAKITLLGMSSIPAH